MPYRWTTDPQAETQEMHLWPHNALPPQGLAATVLFTFTMIMIPTVTVLGSPILWGLLPFVLGAVWALYFALRQNQKSRQVREVLRLAPDAASLTRTDARGQIQAWDSNRYWTQVRKYDVGGPVPHYVTLKGQGREVEIGAFLSEDERLALYDDLRSALSR